MERLIEKSEFAQLLKRYFKTAELFGSEDLLSLPLPLVPNMDRRASVSRVEKLQALYQRFSDCQGCALSKTRSKIIFGMGNLQPQVLFVGEGPDHEEDKSGLPFAGAAGALLDKILSAIRLDRNQVYITNIVKCHPIENPNHTEKRGCEGLPLGFGKPLPSEIEACKTILDQQIEILQPSLICALGDTAATALLKKEEGMSRLRGKVYDFKFPLSKKNVPLIPTYHPAALLRNEKLKAEVWQDMKLLKKILDEKRDKG